MTLTGDIPDPPLGCLQYGYTTIFLDGQIYRTSHMRLRQEPGVWVEMIIVLKTWQGTDVANSAHVVLHQSHRTASGLSLGHTASADRR